jgi:hypothetical protein
MLGDHARPDYLPLARRTIVTGQNIPALSESKSGKIAPYL